MSAQPELRRCQRCDTDLPLSEFHIRRAGTYQGYCRNCKNEYAREWRAANRYQHRAYMRKYMRTYRQRD